ncbi:biotin--acetyl-CoA-carboxylase ligase [Oceaniovalibus guishaninsula JLT2003]|uniref:biotin--[biotin carboxyl-carrier protein] ligase n=1 Tax=Oceaniovalibus guishaninsula JLT2003 TaxID=1231392 RepID=K2HR11_9RHOB|nr:biotin--[acetyl-CoA-carboxylase] ligase [Oceaniovalibus guishaninsula]EKE45169.1 biotin--acetyl-CoA-carboxylase ligase [Oceaniovalibus guishaninsula JLT2003]
MSTEPGWPEGYDRIVLRTVDSTNAEAARLAPELGRPTWIMAEEQQAGRGRRGTVWRMPAGNLAASLILRPTGTAGWAALRSFMAANALYETLALYVDRTRLGLKWPNDVLLDGGKVAGILLEAAGSGGAVDWLIVGVGVNLAAVPDGVTDAAFPPICLADAGARATPEDFLLRLAGFYATEESILEQLGFQPIREKWLRGAARLGEEITARTPQGETRGRFRIIDEAGRLVLETPQGEVRIAAAEVFF